MARKKQAEPLTDFLNGLFSGSLSIDKIKVGNLGKKVSPAVLSASLTESLRHTDSNVRRRTCRVISVIGKKAATPEVLSALLTNFQDNNIFVHIDSIETEGATRKVLSALSANLNQRSAWIEAIRKLGEKAATPEILSALLEILQNRISNYVLQWYGQEFNSQWASAAKALGSLGEKAVIPELLLMLIDRLEDLNYVVYKSIATALSKLGMDINVQFDQILKGETDQNSGSIFIAILFCMHHESRALYIASHDGRYTLNFSWQQQQSQYPLTSQQASALRTLIPEANAMLMGLKSFDLEAFNQQFEGLLHTESLAPASSAPHASHFRAEASERQGDRYEAVKDSGDRASDIPDASKGKTSSRCSSYLFKDKPRTRNGEQQPSSSSEAFFSGEHDIL